MQAKFLEAISDVFRYLKETGKKYLQTLRSVAEFDRLDSHEKARIANELGISNGELRVLASKNKNSADLLVRRMESIGLDPRSTDQAVMRDLQRCCSMCSDKVLCVHELEDNPRKVTWPSYCPNEATLGALTDDQARRMTATSQASWPASGPSVNRFDHDGDRRGAWLI